MAVEQPIVRTAEQLREAAALTQHIVEARETYVPPSVPATPSLHNLDYNDAEEHLLATIEEEEALMGQDNDAEELEEYSRLRTDDELYAQLDYELSVAGDEASRRFSSVSSEDLPPTFGTQLREPSPLPTSGAEVEEEVDATDFFLAEDSAERPHVEPDDDIPP